MTPTTTEQPLTPEQQKAYDEGFDAYARIHSDRYSPTLRDCRWMLPDYLKPDENIGLRQKFFRGWKEAQSCT